MIIDSYRKRFPIKRFLKLNINIIFLIRRPLTNNVNNDNSSYYQILENQYHNSPIMNMAKPNMTNFNLNNNNGNNFPAACSYDSDQNNNFSIGNHRSLSSHSRSPPSPQLQPASNRLIDIDTYASQTKLITDILQQKNTELNGLLQSNPTSWLLNAASNNYYSHQANEQSNKPVSNNSSFHFNESISQSSPGKQTVICFECSYREPIY